MTAFDELIAGNGSGAVLVVDSEQEALDGELDLHLDETLWCLRFEQGRCALARPLGVMKDQLETWFGSVVGDASIWPDTALLCERRPDGWSVRPQAAQEGGTNELTPPAGVLARQGDVVCAREAGEAWVVVRQGEVLEAADLLRLPAKAFEEKVERATLCFADPQQAGGWVVHGEARRVKGDRTLWHIPEASYGLFKAYGSGRGISRALSEESMQYTRAFLAACARRVRVPMQLDNTKNPCYIREIDEKLGITIDGGEGGFKKRRVTLTDLAWALQAQREAEQRGRLSADERLVNELRYLAGTPRSATRYIDGKWALLIVDALKFGGGTAG